MAAEEEEEEEEACENQGLLGTNSLYSSHSVCSLDGVEPASSIPPVPCALTAKVKVATLLVQISQGFLIIMPLAIIVYMVRTFFPHASEARIGSLTGLAGGLLQAGHAASGILWGYASDRFGRRPVLLFGLASTALATIGLGFSVNFPLLCIFRFLGGLLNGTIGTIKTLLAEHVHPSEKSQAFSYISGGFGVGSIVGSSIAGALAQPCDPKSGFAAFRRSSMCAPSGMFTVFPFLLPCIAALVVISAAMVMAHLTFHETLHTVKQSELQQLNNKSSTSDVESAAGLANVLEDKDLKPNPWYKDTNTLVAVWGYVLLAFTHLLFDDTIPLYASADASNGGLELSSKALSIPLGVGGLVLIVWVLNIYPYIVNAVGCLNMTKIFSIGFIVPALAAPTVYFAQSKTAKVALLSAAYGLKTVCGSSAFTPSMQLITQVSPTEHLGMVNGVG
jgi:MFS family permease